MPAPRTGNCIFCDDIRIELGNKFSLMGVYNGDIIFSVPPPVVLTKLAIVGWHLTDIDDVPSEVMFIVRFPGYDQDILNMTFTAPAEGVRYPEGSTKAVTQLMGVVGPVVVQTAGFIEVFAEARSERIRLGRARIVFADQPSAAMQS